jgi:hypothetical protein
MRRIRLLGLAMGALFAALALAAAGASAAVSPENFECGKEAGGLLVKGCTAEGGKGGYVLRPGVGKGKEFKGKGAEAVLHVKTWLGDQTVTCKGVKDNGLATLTGEAKVTVSYSKCYALSVKECNSEGAKKGEIKISGLKGTYGYLEEGISPKVGIRLESEAHPGPTGELVKFDCTSDLEITVTGGLIGEVTQDVNTLSKESETSFVAGEYIGEHTYGEYKYKPLVNLVGWADEQAEIAAELEADKKGEIAKLERPILKTLICGEYVESLLHVHCTPEAYAGLDSKLANKGEDLELKA